MVITDDSKTLEKEEDDDEEMEVSLKTYLSCSVFRVGVNSIFIMHICDCPG